MAARASDRQAQIVAAACRVVAHDGAAAVTTRKIAGEAGVNLATLHFLFGSKDALLVAVLDQITEQMIAVLDRPRRQPDGLRAALAETTAALWALADREPWLPLVRCELLLYLERRPAHVQAARTQQQRYLGALAARYIGSGASLDGRGVAETLAAFVASTLDGLALHSTFGNASLSPKRLRAQALRAVLASVDGDTPRPSVPDVAGIPTDRQAVRRQRSAIRITPPVAGTSDKE